ncbi:MAG TPA: hypothetical protein VMP68_22985 [Candidatus Eisenbacteria bacterium]|nr:hypothetical protein [Candidatus Eisenbacteria bacterium]
MTFKLFFLITVLSMAGPLAAQESLDQAPDCDSRAIDNWNIVQNEMNGAIATEQMSSVIGKAVAKRILARIPTIANWRPLLERRQVMCATLFNQKEEGNELTFEPGVDWNFYLVPSGRFDQIFQEGVNLMRADDQSNVWSCVPGSDPKPSDNGNARNCFEAEIWPEDILRESFPSTEHVSVPSNGTCVCVYGPFVTDYLHGGRPEIHPLEVLWWKDNAAEKWTFVQVQDSSGRFDSQDNFVGPFPQNWQPWASERDDEMRVAIGLPLQAEQPFKLDVFQNHDLCENARRPDQEPTANCQEGPIPGPSHGITYKGKTVLSVNEVRSQEVVSISPHDFCLDRPNNRLIGYLALEAKVGNGTDPGFQVTYVGKNLALPPALPSRPSPKPAFELVPQSLRVEGTGKGLKVTGDIRARVTGRATQLRMMSRQAGKEVPLIAQEESYTLRGLNLLTLDALPVGGSLLERPRRALYPDTQKEKPKSLPSNSSDTSKTLLAGFLHVEVPPEVRLQPHRIESQRLSVAPAYVLATGGRPQPEDEVFVTDQLNQNLAMIQEAPSSADRITFDEPVFKGTDCGSVEHVDCEHGSAVQPIRHQITGESHPDIWVDYQGVEGDPPRASVDISWPTFTPDHLYRLVVTVGFHGPFADQDSAIVSEFWSDGIPLQDITDEQIENLITTVAQFAHVDPGLLKEPVYDSADLLFSINNASYRRANMLRMAAAIFARDSNSIDPDQLEVLVRAARTLAGEHGN